MSPALPRCLTRPARGLSAMPSHGFGSWGHLAGRFFGALSPAGPPPDEEWALSSLLDGEQVLWHRMSGPDRRHAVGVARETVRLLRGLVSARGLATREVVAAALLHDVGKVESGLGTFRSGRGDAGGHGRRPYSGADVVGLVPPWRPVPRGGPG